jgi:uncharacterized protein YlaI
MILALGRYLRILWAFLVTLTIFVGRELHPIIVGGYTKNDPRNPKMISSRVAAKEHELLDGPFKHGYECKICANEMFIDDNTESIDQRDKIYFSLKSSTTQVVSGYLCDDCEDFGTAEVSIRAHWRDTGHRDYMVWDDWGKCASYCNQGKPERLKGSPYRLEVPRKIVERAINLYPSNFGKS